MRAIRSERDGNADGEQQSREVGGEEAAPVLDVAVVLAGEEELGPVDPGHRLHRRRADPVVHPESLPHAGIGAEILDSIVPSSSGDS